MPSPTQTTSSLPTGTETYPGGLEGDDFPPIGEDRPSFPTGPGLAAAPTSAETQGPGMQILGLLFAAGLIAFLLIRARVRRWMIGI